jgi:hypothetical protein
MKGTVYCTNCRAEMVAGQKFCGECGQKSGLPRITLINLVQDFLKTILHGEKGIANLLLGLATKPGTVVTEYVEGKRKKYFNPFSFLAICVTIMILMNGWLKTYDHPPAPVTEVLARMPDRKTRDLYLLSLKRMADAQNFFNRNVKFGQLITAPFYAFFLWLFFRRRGRNMGEIAVAYILLTAFITLFNAAVIEPLIMLFRGDTARNLILWSGMLVEAFYYAWGFKIFFGYKTTGGYIRIVLSFWLIGLIGLILILGVFYLYVYHGGTSSVLKYL